MAREKKYNRCLTINNSDQINPFDHLKKETGTSSSNQTLVPSTSTFLASLCVMDIMFETSSEKDRLRVVDEEEDIIGEEQQEEGGGVYNEEYQSMTSSSRHQTTSSLPSPTCTTSLIIPTPNTIINTIVRGDPIFIVQKDEASSLNLRTTTSTTNNPTNNKKKIVFYLRL